MVNSRTELIAKAEAYYKRGIDVEVDMGGIKIKHHDYEFVEALIEQYVKKDLVIRDLKLQIAEYEREIKNIKSLILE